ncbi:hypothetical protein KUTeg_020816 [Tegillarca granosa]|uniref:Ig-like domain-containing protein n=1 Tax=Tegillarca granosa TaxID=220873 RepID=A0ABQ9EBG4_TEGGR|nr:hypothetical protein KUTeg_020816 [Tegillarca granosa]
MNLLECTSKEQISWQWDYTNRCSTHHGSQTVTFSYGDDNGVFVYAPKPAVLNEDFLMICETTKDINGIRWRQNGQNIAFLYTDTCFVADDSKNYSYSCKEGQFNLTIPKSQLTDELHGSLWTCVNPYGGISNELNLYVNNGPEGVRHSLQSSNLIIPEYESSKAVTCSSDCNPACNFTWWHRGIRVIDGSTLILTNVSKDQTGTYVCNASNVIGNPPKITELKAKTNPVMENDSLDLLCKADSFPTSNVSWIQGNTTLSYAAMADYHYIKQAKCWDTDTYTCKASNGHGEPVSKAIDIFANLDWIIE